MAQLYWSAAAWTRMTSSDVPPSAKKLSSGPMFFAPSMRDQMRRMVRSRGVSLTCLPLAAVGRAFSLAGSLRALRG